MSQDNSNKPKSKLVRITTVPISFEKLLEGQLGFMSEYYDVTAISSQCDLLEDFARKEGVASFCLPLTRKITPLRDLNALYKLYRFLKKEKPLIVHTHTPKAGIVGMLAAKFAKVPIRLHTVAGLPLMEASGFKRRILNLVERKTYASATKVLPNSFGLKEIIRNEKFCSPDKVQVLGEGSSNGIDCNYFSKTHFSEGEMESNRDSLRIPKTDVVFVFVGRIVSDKGINELVSAFVKLQGEVPDCTLLLVGPFEEELDPVLPETKAMIETHPKIITTGYQDDVRIYLALSDMMVFPSYREGFPNVVMQAGAMELPVIASNINGCNEIIEDGYNGLLTPAKDVDKLFAAMKALLTNAELRKRIQSHARAQVISRYDRLKMWKTILNEYREQEANL